MREPSLRHSTPVKVWYHIANKRDQESRQHQSNPSNSFMIYDESSEIVAYQSYSSIQKCPEPHLNHVVGGINDCDERRQECPVSKEKELYMSVFIQGQKTDANK